MFTPHHLLLRSSAPLLRSLPRQCTPRVPVLQRISTLNFRRPSSSYTSPLRTAANQRAESAAQKRRQIMLTVGCLISMSALWLLTQTIELKTEAAPGTAPIAPNTPVVLQTGANLVPSGTSVPAFPKTLWLPHSGGGTTEYVLVGLGIRTVSFLSIEVYVVGVYFAAADLAAVQAALVRRVHPTATTATAEEREVLRGVLADPERGEAFFEELLRGAGVRSLLRIVPTRNTDYQHLRDGWVRGIQGRTSKSALYDDDAFSASLTHFKAAFGQKRAVPKQKTLLLVRDAAGGLQCFYDSSGRNDGKVGGEGGEGVHELGRVEDERLSTVLWLCYLAGPKVASEPARKSVIEGLLALVERPVGTVGSTVVA